MLAVCMRLYPIIDCLSGLSLCRDTRITQLEQSLAEQEDGIQELKQQRSKYIAQLSEDNKTIAELEAR